MPVVFVHGVNVRRDTHYDQGVAARNAYLRQYVLPDLTGDPSKVRIFNPYWGDLAATLAWNHASLPRYGQETFGAEDEVLVRLLGEESLAEISQADTALLTLAGQSLRDVVDLIFAQAIQEALRLRSGQARDAQLEAVISLAAKANNYAEQNPSPAWLKQAGDDQAFYNHLRQAVDGWQPLVSTTADGAELAVIESFGLADDAWNAVRNGYRHLRQGLSRATGQATAVVRKPIHKTMSIFLGDVLKYIQTRGTPPQPGDIVQTIIADLEHAAAARASDDPLIVIAHSMGGNICYDIFSYFRPTFKVDAFITVGSQVSLLEELKLFMKDHPGIPADPGVDRIPKPANVAHWLNIYDTNDVLSFACEGVFSGVADYEYLSGTTLRAAHSAYFQRTSFYQRLAYRLRRLLL